MSRSSRSLRPAFLLAAAAALASYFIEPRVAEDRAVLAAVDAESFSTLAGRRPSAAGDLWERLKAMGVGAVLLREERLSDLAVRGEVLHFTRAETEKWRAAGLTSPGSGLKGDTLWVKDRSVLVRVISALAAYGLDVSTAAAAGSRVLELPPGFDPALVPAGFEPGAVSAVSAAGLIPVAVPTGNVSVVAGQSLWVRTLPVDARREEVLRAAFSRPRRLLIFRLRPGQGLDASIDGLRGSLRELRQSGLPCALPAPQPPSGPEGRTFRLIIVWAIALAGPLLAVRAALAASRMTRERLSRVEMAQQAQPVPEVLVGVAACWAAAALAGALAAWIAPAGWRDGSARAWTVWAWCAPLTVAAVSLFASEPTSRRSWSEPVSRRDLLAWAGLALAAALLLAPRASLRASTLWEGFDRLSAVAGALWWWPWRWREVLVGVPSLVVALAFIERDPKGWLLLGLLAPAGLLAAVGGSGVPLAVTLVHGAAAHALGAFLGACLAVSWGRWDQRPSAS